MSKNTKIVLGIVGAVLVGWAIVYGWNNPQSQIVQQQVAGSSAGATFSTQKIAAQAVVVSTTTTFSMLNSDASDRVIERAFMNVSGGESTSTIYAVACGTSTTASGPFTGSANILDMAIAGTNGWPLFGTTTSAGNLYMASSSPGITGSATTTSTTGQPINNFARIWRSGEYLNCRVSTSIGSNSNLWSSTLSGIMGFVYWAK